jgi:hypothetical protein
MAGIWNLALLVIGLRELHRISTARAIAALLFPLFLLLLAAIAIVAVILSFVPGLLDSLRQEVFFISV